MKLRFFLLAALFASATAFAEEGCPPGLFPNTSGAAGGGCVPFQANAGAAGGGKPSAPSVRWGPSRWGAIAIDQTNSGVGTAADMPSKRKAKEAAMLDCQAKGGNGCKISITYSNQCAVIAWGDNHASVRGRTTLREAEMVAIADCEEFTDNCRVYYSDCTYAERVW